MLGYLKSGREAIRLLYVLIIGLAITNAITDLFIVNKVFVFPNNEKSILFLIFFSFIIRFFLGAYRVLAYDIDIEKRKSKILIDMFGFFSQSLAFFIYSLSFNSLVISQWMIVTICLIDLVWILLLIFLYKTPDKTTFQWLLHNIVMLIVIPLNQFWWNNFVLFYGIAILGFIFDLALNHDFYFSIKYSKSLKILIYSLEEDSKNNAKRKTLSELTTLISTRGHVPLLSNKFHPNLDNKDVINKMDLELLQISDAIYNPNLKDEDCLFLEAVIKKEIRIFSNEGEIPENKINDSQLL